MFIHAPRERQPMQFIDSYIELFHVLSDISKYAFGTGIVNLMRKKSDPPWLPFGWDQIPPIFEGDF